MEIIKRFLNQTRRPEGLLGKMMLGGMNVGSHTLLADWGMAFLPKRSPERVAELGCGGGRNIAALLAHYPSARVEGIDHSPLSVDTAAGFNRAGIDEGRCKVSVGDVSDLPLPANGYDLATAFETVYFWPGLERCFGEVYRVLKPGGLFLIVNESDGQDAAGRKWERQIDGMRVYTAGEIETVLKAAGFTEAETHHHEKNPWIAVLARK